MRTLTKLTLGALAIASLAGIGVASAHAWGSPGRGPAAALAEACSDEMTVGECRALMGDPCSDDMAVADCRAAWEEKREEFEAARQAECLERHEGMEDAEEFCSEMPRGRPGHAHHWGNQPS